jgi:hypothetical protein
MGWSSWSSPKDMEWGFWPTMCKTLAKCWLGFFGKIVH